MIEITKCYHVILFYDINLIYIKHILKPQVGMLCIVKRETMGAVHKVTSIFDDHVMGGGGWDGAGVKVGWG